MTTHPSGDASYVERQRRSNREYRAACKAHGIKPDSSYHAEPQELPGDAQASGGWAYADTEPDEPKQIEVIAPPAIASRDITTLGLISHWMAEFSPDKIRWAAFRVVMGQDSRTVAEIAEYLKVTKRLVQIRIAEMAEWHSKLVAELRRAA